MSDILPPAPIDAPFASYNWVDWYRKVRDAINAAQTVQWTAITGQPTTIGGYGITDAVSLSGNETLSNKVFVPVAGVTLQFVGAITDGSSVGAGTLNNAPTVGDPSKWIPIDDNGTIRYIPTWT